MNNFTGAVRPLHYEGNNLEEIECKFPNKTFTSEDIAAFIEKYVNISGYLVFNKHNTPVRLEIDDITVKPE